MTMPSSITRLVELSRKASAGARPAPLPKIERVELSAAKLQLLAMKPKKVALPMAAASSPPSDFCMRASVTKVLINALTR